MGRAEGESGDGGVRRSGLGHDDGKLAFSGGRLEECLDRLGLPDR